MQDSDGLLISSDAGARRRISLRGTVLQPRIVLLTLLLVLLLLAPLILPAYLVFLLFTIFLYIALAHGWNLLAGYTGLVSLGQAAFLGVGAYSGTMMMIHLKLPMLPAALGAGVAAACFAAVISPPVFRFRGIYFAIGTLAVAEALRLWMIAWPVTGGAQSLPVPLAAIPDTGVFYYVALAIVIGATLVPIYAINTKLGKGWRAIRDNEDVAQSLGVNVYQAKLAAFVISGFITGVVGAVWAARLGSIEPYSIFGAGWTIAMVNMVIIGGMATVVGPVIGAVFFVFLGHVLADYYAVQVILTGAILIAVIRFAPQGIWGLALRTSWVQRTRSWLTSSRVPDR